MSQNELTAQKSNAAQLELQVEITQKSNAAQLEAQARVHAEQTDELRTKLAMLHDENKLLRESEGEVTAQRTIELEQQTAKLTRAEERVVELEKQLALKQADTLQAAHALRECSALTRQVSEKEQAIMEMQREIQKMKTAIEVSEEERKEQLARQEALQMQIQNEHQLHVTNLEASVHTATSASDAAERLVEDLRGQLQESVSAVDAANIQITGLQTTILEVQEQSTLEQRHSETRLHSAQQQATAAEERAALVTAELAECTDALNRSQSQLRTIEQERSDLEANARVLQTTTAQHERQNRESSENVKALEIELKAAHRTAEGELKAAHRTADELRQRCDTLSAENDEIERQRSGTASLIAQLENRTKLEHN